MSDDDEYYPTSEDYNTTDATERKKRINMRYKQQYENNYANSKYYNSEKNDEFEDFEDDNYESPKNRFALRDRRNVNKIVSLKKRLRNIKER